MGVLWSISKWWVRLKGSSGGVRWGNFIQPFLSWWKNCPTVYVAGSLRLETRTSTEWAGTLSSQPGREESRVEKQTNNWQGRNTSNITSALLVSTSTVHTIINSSSTSYKYLWQWHMISLFLSEKITFDDAKCNLVMVSYIFSFVHWFSALA